METNPSPPPPTFLPVLVVEDDDAVRELISAVFQRFSIPYHSTSSEEEARQSWAQNQDPIGIALIDVTLPGETSGVELALEFHATKSSLKVILTSGYPKETVLKDLSLPENFLFLEKPFAPTALVEMIQSLS